MLQVNGSVQTCSSVAEWLTQHVDRLSQGHSLVAWDHFYSDPEKSVSSLLYEPEFRLGVLDTTDVCWVVLPLADMVKAKEALPSRIRRVLCSSKGRRTLAAGGKTEMIKQWLQR